MVQWQKSSFSGGGDGDECVELGRQGSEVLLRESDEPPRILTVGTSALAAMLRHLQADASGSPR
ncbi:MULTISPECIES: DUF397 domain-containing protein [Streptomyces]|uniref:DUF397 domain-containing protein n=1 Tax=Streptomyces griseoaurantiacus TaxID=68213 RepID=A0ABZ1V1Y7_9ACTN|nr:MULTISPECIES: DUF397 domain-containing protein [Streptomyces]MDX3362125.1 DUF397 domain-containing protein [Streptomyces sp. ME02-6978.2a]